MVKVLRKVIASWVVMGMMAGQVWAFTLPQPVPVRQDSIPVSGSTVTIRGLTDQENTLYVNGVEVPVQPDGTFVEEQIIPTGQTTIDVRVTDPQGNSKSYTKTFMAEEDHFFFVGIADGTLNFVDTSEGFDLKRDNTSFDEGTHTNGKISYYLTGKIQGKYLIKSSLDTDKSTQEKLFTNIDPDKYYPIYGDNSTVVYDAHSQGKFYLRVDWDKSGIVVGNYQTQIGDEDSTLTEYQRTLYGAKLHWESMKQTSYGDAASQAQVFLAEANQFRGHSELLATGTSLYYMRHRNIVEGSEQVRIEIRDQISHTTLYTIDQAENVDYEIKYDEGRIMFTKAPVSKAMSNISTSELIQDGYDVFVVVDYEYKEQDAFPIAVSDVDQQTGGFRAFHNVTDNLKIGGTYVQEDKDFKNHTMYGVDSTLKVGNFTRVNVQYAETREASSNSYVSYNGGYDYETIAIDEGVRGKAYSADFTSSIGEYLGKDAEFLELSGYFQKLDKGFSPVATLFESGTTKYGLSLAHRVSEDDLLRYQMTNQYLDDFNDEPVNEVALDLQGSHRETNHISQWVHDHGDRWTFTTEHRAQIKDGSTSEIFDKRTTEDTDHIVGETVEYKYTEDTTLMGGVNVGLSDSEDTLYRAGITQKISEDLNMNVTGAVGQDRNAVIAGLEKRVNPQTTEYMHYQIKNSVVRGRSSIISSGSSVQMSDRTSLNKERQFVTSDERGSYTSDVTRLGYQLNPKTYVDAQYERREEALDSGVLGKIPRDAFSGTLSHHVPDKYGFDSKLEYRTENSKQWQFFTTHEANYKINQDLQLFGEYEYSQAYDDNVHLTLSRIDKKQMALAYRPVNFDWFNGLFRYIRLHDDRPRNLTSADGGFFEVKSTYDEYAGEFAFDLPLNFQFVEKVAYRKEDLIAVNTVNTVEVPDVLRAYLVIHRLNYHLTEKVDVATEYRTLRLDGMEVNDLNNGFLFEFTYKVMDHLALGAGYNFTAFKENLRELNKRKAEGFFMRVQGTY